MAKPINTLSPEIIAELGEMKRYIDRMRRGGTPGPHEPGSRFREKQVRIARTTTGLDCLTYPTSPANTFVVELGSGDFLKACGDNEHTFTPYAPAELRYAHTLSGKYYDQGEVVPIMLIHDKWYIIDAAGNCDTIRFAIISANPVAKTAVVAIQSRPVGCASVPEEVNATVTVCDPMECLLNESEADLVGRQGWAKYMLPISTNICQPTEQDIEPHWEIFTLCCPNCVAV